MGINKMQLILDSTPLTRQVSQGLDPSARLFDLRTLFWFRLHICSLQIFILLFLPTGPFEIAHVAHLHLTHTSSGQHIVLRETVRQKNAEGWYMLLKG